MKSCQEIIVSDFKISSKEQQIKNRFLNNSKLNPAHLFAPQSPEADTKNSRFPQKPQTSLKAQPKSPSIKDPRKKSKTIQPQVDHLKQERKSPEQVLLQASHPISQNPKRLMAEILAPLDKQIKEVKSCYEETKSVAKEIISQINDLKKSIDERGAFAELHTSVEDSIKRLTIKRQAFEGKAKETENLALNIANDREDSIRIETCKKSVEQLRRQIEAAKKDAEEIELDMRNRFKRIVQEAKRVKKIPEEVRCDEGFEGSEMKIEKMLGGRVDYGEILWEINEMKTKKNEMMQEFKKMTPAYPKIVKQVQLAGKKADTVKPARLVPASQSNLRKSMKTKPSSLKNIAVQTKTLKLNRQLTNQDLFDREYDRNWEKEHSCSDKVKQSKPNIKDDYRAISKIELDQESEPVEERYEKVAESLNNSYRAQEEYNYNELNEMLRYKSPQHFQTKPGACKGEQTKSLTFDHIYPNLKNIETQEPPKPSIIEKTVDAVTEYLLSTLLPKEKPNPKIPEPKASKWLGVEEISELTELGLYFNPLTIEKIGKEVLKSEINELKSKKIRTPKAPAHESQDLKPQPKSEHNSKEPQEKQSENPETSHEDSQDNPKETLFDKISPKTPPQFYSQRFEIAEKSSNMPEPIQPHRSSGIQTLLNPNLLSRMNASSIQHYISALIDSGHIPRSQGTPSFYSRSPTPQSQSKPTPQCKQTSFSSIFEPKLPEEVKEFLSSPIGGQIYSILKESPSLSPQQVIESLLSNRELNLTFPVRSDLIGKPSKKDALEKHEPRDARMFDLQAEEQKIYEESSSVRRVFNIPVLEIYRKSHSNPDECLVTDSEVSGLSQSDSAASEIFGVRNSEVLVEFMDCIKKAKDLEAIRSPRSADLSEGEVKVEEEGLSSGEISKVLLSKHKDLSEANKHQFSDSGSDLFSQEEFDASDDD